MADEHSNSVKKDDDEVSLDFGKIFSFFKKKDKPATHEVHSTHQMHQTSPTNETHTAHHTKETDEERITLDANKIKGIFSFVKTHPVVFLLLLVLVLQFIPNDGWLPWGGIAMRMHTKDLPMTENWATSNIQNFIKQDISNLVNQNYPNLPATNKNTLIDDEFAKAIKQGSYTVRTGTYQGQTISIADEISKSSQSLKEFWQYDINGSKFVYMPDIDPYYYLLSARNLIEKGHIYDKLLADGTPWNTHMLAPLGSDVDPNKHPYVLVLIYKVMHVFNPNIDLMNAACYFPVILLLLSLIPAFFVGRRIAGNVAGLSAATLVAISPAILGRTLWGHADTDIYVVFFPLLITWLCVEAFAQKDNIKRWALAGATGLSLGIFSMFWGGWWYISDFIIVAMAIYLVYLFIRRKDWKENLITSLAVVCSTGIFITLFAGFNIFLNSFWEPLKFALFIKAAAQVNLWPNVLTTVAEMNPTSLSAVIANLGGYLLFIVALVGIVWLVFKKEESKRFYAILFALWFVGTLYASIKGIRFAILLAPAFAIALSVSFAFIYDLVTRLASKELNLKKWLVGSVLVILVCLLLMSPTKIADTSARNDLPLINDAWWSALIKINQESKPDAIINSWWDFGHHFKYIADRAVTFDGASQTGELAHWIGKVLLTSDEKLAVGILRMLDCGGNTAFEELDKKMNDVSKSVQILYKVVVLDKDKAEALLEENGLSMADSENVLKYTHCTPPEDYFITSEDMIGKAGVWGHFGSWDFERAEIWQEVGKLPKEKAVKAMQDMYGYTAEKADQTYYDVHMLAGETEANTWIAPWPGYLSGQGECTSQENLMVCANGLLINTTNYEARIKMRDGEGLPKSIAYIDANGDFTVKQFNNSNIEVSAVIIPNENGGFSSILCAPELAGSMFTRLYFFEGHGLKQFKPFDTQRQLTGGMIYVWKIGWEAGEPNVMKMFVKKESVSKGDKVSVDYIGWLDNNTVFDSSVEGWKEKNITKKSSFEQYETKPVEFDAGAGQMIKGFDAAVLGMKLGETKTVELVPEDAYGAEGNHPLANKTLNFKIKVVGIG